MRACVRGGGKRVRAWETHIASRALAEAGALQRDVAAAVHAHTSSGLRELGRAGIKRGGRQGARGGASTAFQCGEGLRGRAVRGREGRRTTLASQPVNDTSFIAMSPAPSALIAFFTPQFNRLRTSFLPSTIISEVEDSTFGPLVKPWKEVAVPVVKTERTSSITVFVAASPEFTITNNKSFAILKIAGTF